MNIYDRLKKDHEKQRTLADILSKTEGDSEDRRELWEKFKAELRAHAAAEEQVFYAELMTVPEATDQTRHSVAEHEEADELVDDLDETDMSTSAWLQKFKKLKDSVIHHVDEEEADVFVLARKHISAARADELGEEFGQRKPAELED